ncbi:MAG: PKD domain-containing protein [Nanoarchaeota archaeon]
MRNKNLFYINGLIIILISFTIIGVSASVNYLHNNIYSNYSSGEVIRGNFNLRLANHPGDVEVTSNFPGSLTLIDLIKNQSGLVEGVNYNCSTNGCQNDYTSSGNVNQMQLSSGETGFVGFEVQGSGIEIMDAKLRVSSNAPSSCIPNLYVDLLADGQNIFTSNRGSGESCGVKHTGCYDSSNVGLATIVTGREYCEKIVIPAGPSFIVGGEINRGTGNSNLTMKLYDFDTTSFLGSCKLPQNSPNSQSTQELSCVVNHSSYEADEYYVCITTSLNNGYQIGQETLSPTCGTAQGFGQLNSDFDLFAETMMYASSPSLVINQTSYEDLGQIINQYVQNVYGGDCQSSSCFIPLGIFGTNQIVDFNDAELNYESFGASRPSTQQIQELDHYATRITSNNLTLDISKANFMIPIESNRNKFELYFDGDLLFDKTISIRRSFSFDITPKSVAFGQNTRFTAFSNSTNITRTIWNFGDGTPVQTVNGSFIFHAFTRNNSSFDINVTAINNQTQTTRQFRVFVGNPRDIANLTIIEYRRRITNITNQINSYPSWAVQKIQSLVRLNNLTSGLNYIELSYNNASTEQDYQDIMLDLIDLDVPAYVSSRSSADNLPLSIGYENINSNYIEQIENEDFSDNVALKDQIIAWMDDNFNSQISFRKIEKTGDNGVEPIGTLFTIRTNPLVSISTNTYLILGQNIDSVGLYKTNYNPLSVTSGVDYILLDTSSSQLFEFFIEGDIDAETLGAYISPSLEILSNIEAPSGECNINNICENDETAGSCPEDCSKRWFKFTLIGWVILIIFAFVAYIILQEWYKKYYQNSLFPESNDLYNLVNFIYNARKSGLSDSDIKSRLKQQKWSNERIRFALRKINGKRVGMFEIPIFTWREHKETVKQIADRQPQGVINARFIKRPYYT